MSLPGPVSWNHFHTILIGKDSRFKVNSINEVPFKNCLHTKINSLFLKISTQGITRQMTGPQSNELTIEGPPELVQHFRL